MTAVLPRTVESCACGHVHAGPNRGALRAELSRHGQLPAGRHRDAIVRKLPSAPCSDSSRSPSSAIGPGYASSADGERGERRSRGRTAASATPRAPGCTVLARGRARRRMTAQRGGDRRAGNSNDRFSPIAGGAAARFAVFTLVALPRAARSPARSTRASPRGRATRRSARTARAPRPPRRARRGFPRCARGRAPSGSPGHPRG